MQLNDAVISGPGGNAISNNSSLKMPLSFTYNQSILQGFYYFSSVVLNGESVDDLDWIGAFKDDVCVGSRKWDLSNCNNNVCDVPVMGDDGGLYSEGYMLSGEVPTFKTLMGALLVIVSSFIIFRR